MMHRPPCSWLQKQCCMILPGTISHCLRAHFNHRKDSMVISADFLVARVVHVARVIITERATWILFSPCAHRLFRKWTNVHLNIVLHAWSTHCLHAHAQHPHTRHYPSLLLTLVVLMLIWIMFSWTNQLKGCGEKVGLVAVLNWTSNLVVRRWCPLQHGYRHFHYECTSPRIAMDIDVDHKQLHLR